MPNNVEKMTFNYSPNFDLIKRSNKQIKYLKNNIDFIKLSSLYSSKLAIAVEKNNKIKNKAINNNDFSFI